MLRLFFIEWGKYNNQIMDLTKEANVFLQNVDENNIYEDTDHLYDPLRKSYVHPHIQYVSDDPTLGSKLISKMRELTPNEANQIRKNTYIPINKRLSPSHNPELIQRVRARSFREIQVTEKKLEPITQQQFQALQSKKHDDQIIYQYGPADQQSRHVFVDSLEKKEAEQIQKVKREYLVHSKRIISQQVHSKGIIPQQVHSTNYILHAERPANSNKNFMEEALMHNFNSFSTIGTVNTADLEESRIVQNIIQHHGFDHNGLSPSKNPDVISRVRSRSYKKIQAGEVQKAALTQEQFDALQKNFKHEQIVYENGRPVVLKRESLKSPDSVTKQIYQTTNVVRKQSNKPPRSPEVLNKIVYQNGETVVKRQSIKSPPSIQRVNSGTNLNKVTTVIRQDNTNEPISLTQHTVLRQNSKEIIPTQGELYNQQQGSHVKTVVRQQRPTLMTNAQFYEEKVEKVGTSSGILNGANPNYKYNLFNMLDEPINSGCKQGCQPNEIVAHRTANYDIPKNAN